MQHNAAAPVAEIASSMTWQYVASVVHAWTASLRHLRGMNFFAKCILSADSLLFETVSIETRDWRSIQSLRNGKIPSSMTSLYVSKRPGHVCVGCIFREMHSECILSAD